MTMNEAGNQGDSITVALPKEEYRMNFDLEDTRRKLIALRVKVGAKSPRGYRISKLIEQLKNYQAATGDQKANLAKLIQTTMRDLDAFQ